MTAVLIALFVEIIIIALLMPLKIRLRGYFSLDRKSGGVDLKIFAITVARVRFERENGKITFKINEKPILKPTKDKQDKMLKSAKSALGQIKNGQIKLKGRFLAVIGGEGPMNSALIFGIVDGFLHILKAKGRLYADFERERADVDFEIGFSVSIAQALTLSA